MNKLFITQKIHKTLNILAIISTLCVLGFIGYEAFLFKTNRVHRSSIMEDIGDYSQDKSGSITWKELKSTEIKYTENSGVAALAPKYSDKLMKLNHHTVSIKGFMFPLEAGTKQSHFLLSPYVSTCPFCLPADGNQLIEIHPKEAVEVYGRSITVRGEFELLSNQNATDDIIYHINNATIE